MALNLLLYIDEKELDKKLEDLLNEKKEREKSKKSAEELLNKKDFIISNEFRAEMEKGLQQEIDLLYEVNQQIEEVQKNMKQQFKKKQKKKKQKSKLKQNKNPKGIFFFLD